MEDLWAFNDEGVARAICASGIPVISAVGHEPDVTIADFAADLRAVTPSNAAELAVPDQNEVYAALLGLRERLARAMARRLERERQRLEGLSSRRALTDPMAPIQDRRVLLDYQRERLSRGLERRLERERGRLAGLAAALDAMSPLKVLGRGYAIAQRGDGKVIASVADAVPGEDFTLRLPDGQRSCRVLK